MKACFVRIERSAASLGKERTASDWRRKAARLERSVVRGSGRRLCKLERKEGIWIVEKVGDHGR